MASSRLLVFVLIAAAFPLPGCAEAFRKKSDADLRAEESQRSQDAKPAPSPRILPETYLASGQMLESKGDLAGAIAQYEKAIVAKPRYAAAYNRIGIAYQKLGRFPDAVKAFTRGIEADPAAAFLRNNLGYCQMVQGHIEEAEHEFRAALSLRTDFVRARMNLATLLGRTGRLDEAFNEFARVVPTDTAHFNVGVLCVQQRQYDQAKQCFDRAVAINPACPGAREYLSQLKQYAKIRPIEPKGPVRAMASAVKKPVDEPTTPLAGTADDETGDKP